MFRSFGRQLGNKAMPMDATYILYDIPGTATKHQSWSPNVWKTRYVTIIIQTYKLMHVSR